MTEVYYVEDDKNIAESVKEYLEQNDCKVTIFFTITEIMQVLRCQRPDIVLMDWNMPDGQGSELCQWIRERWVELPIIFLTVRSEVSDIVTGFQNGADDYVVKPFELEVLHSRIQALLRRVGQGKDTRLRCDHIVLDTEKLLLTVNGKEITVSQPEFQIMLLLLKNKGKTVTRQKLLEEIWDSNGNYVNDNTLTVTMKRLREKLNSPGCIKTIRSFGYRMEEIR